MSLFPCLALSVAVAGCAAVSRDAAMTADGVALPQIFRPGDFILFQGDSITHGGRGRDMNHYLGHGYQAEIAMRYLAAYPTNDYWFSNRGVSGNTSAQLRGRWANEGWVVANDERGYSAVYGKRADMPRHPDVISILVGVNDRYFGTVRHEEYGTNLAWLVETTLASNRNARIVLGEPFRVPMKNDIEFYKMQALAAKLALKYRLPLVRYQKFYNEDLVALNPNPRYWSWDGVHPTYAAHMKMADEWIRSVDEFQRHPTTNTCLIAQGALERDSYDWYERHARIVREQKSMDPEIVFVGDSIVHFWAGRHTIGGADAEPRWREAFGKYRTLNLGFGFDRLQNVLWRLDHGEMDDTVPKLVVMMIGTNNNYESGNARRNSAEEIAEGIVACSRRVLAKAPHAHLALFAIFPRGESPNESRDNNERANAIVKKLVEDDPRITFVDIGERFIGKDGKISKSLMGDFLHPTTAGYSLWVEALNPLIKRYVGK